MNEEMHHPASHGGGDWPLRPVLLSAIGGMAGLAIQQWLGNGAMPPAADRLAVAVALGTSAIGFGIVAERVRLLWAVVFSIVTGAIAGFIIYWQGVPGGSADFLGWRLACLFLAIAIAAPLFQTARDEGRWHLPYRAVYGHALTNVVLWFAAWSFVAVVWLMSWLLAALFRLIKIDFLERLLGKEWFAALLLGAAFGAAVGLFRERDRILRLLQTVVTSVLSVLAPVLGAGLLLFLLALPFAGLDALWEATRATTPILLACVVAALILANAVIGTGESDSEDRSNRLLRYGAMALAVVMLPLAAITAVATGLRIDQHGFTPDRLWALTFVIFATAFGIAYLVSLVRGRADWATLARAANLRLAIAIAAAALFLATPIVSFNAIATADQVARLTTGRIKPDKFDWAALAFDFGAPGKAALKRLAHSADAATASRARSAAKASSRWEVASIDTLGDGAAALARRVRVQPRAVPLPDGLLASFRASATDKGSAALWYEPGGSSAILVTMGCERCPPAVAVSRRNATGDWHTEQSIVAEKARSADQDRAVAETLAKRGFDIRRVERRQVYVAGVPVGEPFE